ncbi:UNVERIFIED_CONTAM: hypothetical protein Scaly_2649600 [Sesamum calycinum]|uniref:Uncharacterized protein n=1 Tax=Sesamum calycinum TaxID=2727403 RepID=A0AAW2JBY1_9LAMI
MVANQSQLGVVVELVDIKADGYIFERIYDKISQWTNRILSSDHTLPRDYYNTKKLVKDLGLPVEKIDACKNSCMLYWKDDVDLENCKFYGDAEPRNVRLGLCTNGFAPHGRYGRTYSCWLVIITPYNLSSSMCMSSEYMFLMMVIPGLSNPKRLVDVYLGPLIKELLQFGHNGVWVESRGGYGMSDLYGRYKSIPSVKWFLPQLKEKVKKKAHIEASIVEAYIIEEIGLFMSQYFDSGVQYKRRNDECTSSNDGFQVSIFKLCWRLQIPPIPVDSGTVESAAAGPATHRFSTSRTAMTRARSSSSSRRPGSSCRSDLAMPTTSWPDCCSWLRRSAEIQLGCPVNQMEVFEKVYKKKDDGQWSGPRAEEVAMIEHYIRSRDPDWPDRVVPKPPANTPAPDNNNDEHAPGDGHDLN